MSDNTLDDQNHKIQKRTAGGWGMRNKAKKDIAPMKKRLAKAATKISTATEKLSASVHTVCLAGVILVCVFAILSCIAYIQLESNSIKWAGCFKVLNLFHIMSADPIDKEYIITHYEQLKNILEFVVNIFIAVIGLILSLVTAISYFRKIAAVKRQSSFKKYQIFDSGKDDIKIMLSYYKNADVIKIFSSTFSWVNNSEEMKNILMEAAEHKKLSLYTANTKTAKENLGEETALAKIVFEAATTMRFSYIERDNARYLLYRQEKDGNTYVIVVHQNIESTYLLEVLSQLLKDKYNDGF